MHAADGGGYSLVLQDPAADPDPDDPENWRTSSSVHGSPGASDVSTEVESRAQLLPDRDRLLQNYPNPFNPGTTIQFQLAESTEVALRIYDLLGREVTMLVEARLPSGVHAVTWDAAGVAGGVYFCRLEASGATGPGAARKLVVVKESIRARRGWGRVFPGSAGPGRGSGSRRSGELAHLVVGARVAGR